MPSIGKQSARRALDLALVFPGLLLLAPVLAAVAVLVKLTSPGPVLYVQERVGRFGIPFRVFKFRSMHVGSDRSGALVTGGGDPRVTPLGRWLRRTKLDELPQIWNVLRGEMSLVGPRPLAEKEMQFCPAWRDARLKVRPGITGLWQVSGRSKTSFHDWIRLDIEYVRERSLMLDLRILLRTLFIVFHSRGSF